MPLLWNQTYQDWVSYHGGRLQALGLTVEKSHSRLIDNAFAFGQFTSIPQGYQAASRAVVPTLKESGFMAVRWDGDSSTALALTALGNMAATLDGDSTLSLNGNLGLSGVVTLSGDATLTAGVTAIGNMSALMAAGASPNATEIAQATLDSVVESGVSLKDVLRLLLAVAAGDATGLDANPAFKSADGSKTRVAGTISSGNRTITTRDAT